MTDWYKGMDNLPNIISKKSEDVTDAEFECLKEAISTTKDYLETLQRAYERLTGTRYKC